MSVSPVRTALLGYGSASQVFHVPLLRALPEVQLVAVASRNPGAAAALPEAQIFNTSEDLLAESDAELVVVATPNRTHVDLARAALEAGRHVLVEKPFTLTVAEAQALVTLAQERGLVLSVFHNRRWDGDFLTLRQVLESGELGRVTALHSHFDRFRPEVRDRWRESAEPGAGIWYDLGPHLIDQALTLFGLPQRVRADLARVRPGAQSDDRAEVTLDYSDATGERRVTLHASMLTAWTAPRFAVHGTAGSFVIEGLDPQEEALKAGETPGAPGWGHSAGRTSAAAGRLITAQGEREIPRLPGDYPALYRALAASIREGSPPPVTVQQALDTVRVLAAAQRSQTLGSGWVSLDALA
ncbi:oxidoreductase [Deinococcus piscis]|uniref:Oxidoreductase n=1 Tax=Deinococcus piscis TaxID=394230 RepID=A0ABQ3JXU1_9DEIO|nr:oxidoreductase [Deinococcus piscis]GHF94068.1 oxidoreductase [Deinococcus piscis]